MPARAYVAVKNYQNDDRRPYIFKTADYGKTWTKIVNGIPDDDFVHAVREDPGKRGLLFAGTEHGIYVSFDDGAEWQSLALNLPDTQVPDLVIEGNDLVIATHGRVLHPGRHHAAAPVHAGGGDRTRTCSIRRRRSAMWGRAAFRYFLKQPADKVQIDILDAKGQVVRTYTGTPEDDRARRSRRPRRPRRTAAADEAEDEGGGGGGGRGARSPPCRARRHQQLRVGPALSRRQGLPGMILWSGGRGARWRSPDRTPCGSA